jgi:iron complex transport system permease protein
VAFGSRIVGWDDIVAAFGGTDETLDQAAVVKRIPRTVLAALVGAALALSGAVMQGVTRNPLADPGILGINMGAMLAIAVAMVTVGLSTATEYIWVAIAGAALSAVFV